MSGRREKEKRRALKAKQQELLKRMNPNQPQNKQDLGLTIISALEDFIKLYTYLTGEKPSSITLTDVAYTSYVQEIQRHAEILGLNPGFKTEEPTFNGVKLVKKSPLIVPAGTPTTPPVTPAPETPETPTEPATPEPAPAPEAAATPDATPQDTPAN